MKKERIVKSCKKLTASFAAALLLTCSSGLTTGLTANAEVATTQYAMGCLRDSEEVLRAHQATDEEVYDLDFISETDDTVRNTLVNVCKAAKSASLSSSVDLTNQFPTPRQQGQQNSCVAWAVGYALKSHEEYVEHSWSLNNTKAQYSPAYIYNQIHIGNDSGAFVSDAMNLIVDQGVCSLYNMNYNDNNYTTQPNASQTDIASNYKANDWRIVRTLSNVKATLADGNGVVVSVGCYPDFDAISTNNDTYDVINTNDTSRGNHAICLIGYDDVNERFKFINSWGTNWGVNGYGYISYDMFNDNRNCGGYGYTFIDQSHNDSTKFFTNTTDSVRTLTDIRAYSSRDYYDSLNSQNNYDHTISSGTVIEIDEFLSSGNGLHPCFKTSDGYYINAQKSQLEAVDNDEVVNILINGNNNNSIGSVTKSETSNITFTPNNNVQYNNHNTLKIDYTVNQSDSYNGYAGAEITGDSNVSTSGATGIGFWYMTPQNQTGTIAFCLQGSVTKKLVQLPATNGEWTYHYASYNFNNTNMSNIEIYINGNESDCVTTPATGTIYIAELAATNVTTHDDPTASYSFTATAGTGGTITGTSNGTYQNGTTITVTASPDSGYEFVGWSETNGGSIISTNANYTFTINQNTTLFANFQSTSVTNYTLTVVTGEGCRSVVYFNSDSNGNLFVSGQYPAGYSLSLIAFAQSGYEFAGWWTNSSFSGDPIKSSNVYNITLNSDMTLYPKFVLTSTNTDSDIFIKGVSNTVSDWTNANSGSSLTITSGSTDYLFTDSNNVSSGALKLNYTINTDDEYGGYAGRTVSLENTYNNRGTSNYDGIGFWYLTPSGFSGQIALCLQSVSAELDDLIQLQATNGQWQYYFYETSKTNISDMTFYINGSKNGYSTTASNGIATGTLYLANMKVTEN